MTPPRTSDPGRLIAHRGASQVAPENTLAAFRAAAAQGVHWIEFDVTLLGDDLPVIHHDATLDRCTDRQGAILRLGAGDLAGIDAGKRFPDFAGEPIPTLQDTLELIDALDLYANLELKLNDAQPKTLARKAADALSHWDWATDRILVSSFDHETLMHFRAIRPEQPIAALWEDTPKDWRDTTTALTACGIHMDYRNLRLELLDDVLQEGLDLRVYTINKPALMAPFRDRGLTGVITDHPPVFQSDAKWSAWAET
ncbi:MAG: glycerophosphodiester phosphodiesterase family protein [Pseudomonadota bacterium]